MLENLKILQKHLKLFLSKIEGVEVFKHNKHKELLLLSSADLKKSNHFISQSNNLVVDCSAERFVCVPLFYECELTPKWPTDKHEFFEIVSKKGNSLFTSFEFKGGLYFAGRKNVFSKQDPPLDKLMQKIGDESKLELEKFFCTFSLEKEEFRLVGVRHKFSLKLMNEEKTKLFEKRILNKTDL